MRSWFSHRFRWLLGAFGWGEGGGYFFALASICLIQAAYPTLLGWALASLTYVTFTGLYLLWALLERNQLRTDPDLPAFLAGGRVFLAIGMGLVLSKPKVFPPTGPMRGALLDLAENQATQI